jgi:pimeloyl-ACP methyl ester carboxylesterase
VLVIGTPDDRLVRPADVQRTADSYGVEPVWFPGMGHDVMLDRGWDDVLGTVLEFCDALPPWGQASAR